MRDGVVDKRTVDGLTMVTLAGELDVATAPGLRRALTPFGCGLDARPGGGPATGHLPRSRLRA